MNRLELASIVLAAAGLAGGASAQSLVRSFSGPAAGALFGKACVVVPDQNGDAVQDLLVGAPGFNSGRGAIDCVSGAYLATGAGAPLLWSLAPAVNAGDQFGYALAVVGDETGDGVVDFLVGQPGYDAPNVAIDGGAVRLVDGSSRALVSLIFDHEISAGFGSALAVVGDVDADGKSDVLAGAPGQGNIHTAVFAIRGAHLSASADVASIAFFSLPDYSSSELGASLAAGFDLDSDGAPEFVVGEPGYDGSGPLDAGRIQLYSLIGTGGYVHWNDVEFGVAGERFGAAVSAVGDYDGDGVVDLVVGAPGFPGLNGTEPGRAVVLSGWRVRAGLLPYDLATLAPPASNPVPISEHFGAAVRGCADLNGDGVGEILVGAPDFRTVTPVGPGKGEVVIFSGATLARLAAIRGNNLDRLGDALGDALGDLDGDGFPEFVVAGSSSDAGGIDSGIVKCYRLFPCPSTTYCTGKPNSLGCTPAMSFVGTPSASSTTPFTITATNVLNQQNGLLYYSHLPASAPFQGGTKCAANPIVRTPIQSSGGSTSGSDCSGAFGFDFNGWIQNGSDPGLGAGNEIFSQYWSRDPASPSPTSLSNALRFLISP